MSRYLCRPVRVVQNLVPADYPGALGGPTPPAPTVPAPGEDPDPKRRGHDSPFPATVGWRIHFEDGLSADVRLQPVGVVGSAFPDLQARFYSQHDQWGDVASSSDRITAGAVKCVDSSPYETYHQGSILVSRGSRHEAVVEASSVASPHFREAMAGIAVLALRLIGE